MPQRFGLFLQILEVLRAGNLRHLACLFALVNLDTQDLYLLFQLFLASDHLAGHPLEDSGQAPILARNRTGSNGLDK